MSTFAVRSMLAACVTLAGACACMSSSTFRLVEGDYPGELRAPTTLEHDVFWRQYVTAYWTDEDGDEGSRGFDAVVQRARGTLTVAGLDPTGRIGFSIVHDGETIELENNMPREFPFEPRFVLLDVQRAFFPWLASGETEALVNDELVREVHANGRLRERTFERSEATGATDGPTGIIRVEYRWKDGDVDVPSAATLDNGWFGYRLEIETLEQKRIEVPAEASA